jgi:hypothetical protein
MYLSDASRTPTIEYPYSERRTLRIMPLYPKLHCAKAIQFFGWRPDHPGFPPTARTIGPLSEDAKRLNN